MPFWSRFKRRKQPPPQSNYVVPVQKVGGGVMECSPFAFAFATHDPGEDIYLYFKGGITFAYQGTISGLQFQFSSVKVIKLPNTVGTHCYVNPQNVYAVAESRNDPAVTEIFFGLGASGDTTLETSLTVQETKLRLGLKR